MAAIAPTRSLVAIVGHGRRRFLRRAAQSSWDRAFASASTSPAQADGSNNPGTSRMDQEADMNYVRSTMRKWMKEYVLDHELCPFVNIGDSRISVWTGESVLESATNANDDGVTFQRFVEDEMDTLLANADDKEWPNSSVVLPFVKEFGADIDKFTEFYSDLAKSVPGACSGDDDFNDNRTCKVQLFPFHMDADWRFKTPWPTIFLLRTADLERAREEGGEERSLAINEKNDLTLEAGDTQRRLARLVFESAKFPDPIRLTKAICPRRKAELHAEGHRITEAPAVGGDVGVDDIMKQTPPVRIKVSKKTKAKGKGKRKPKR